MGLQVFQAKVENLDIFYGKRAGWIKIYSKNFILDDE